MDVYYKKAMGNGSLSTKFRLESPGNAKRKKNNIHDDRKRDDGRQKNNEEGRLHESSTHSSFNCDRCYRKKKKCLRTYPKCDNCTKVGADCEYIERGKKRRKSLPEEAHEKTSEEETPSNNGAEPVSQPQDLGDISISAAIHPRKLVSIPSLLASEKAAGTPNNSSQRYLSHKARKLSENRKESLSEDGYTLSDKLLSARLQQNSSTCRFSEEFINIKAFEGKLPLYFIKYFLRNYSSVYPFLDEISVMNTFENIDFTQETFINFNIYLMLCCGCLIYDYQNDTQYFKEYFNEKTINSIIDVLRFNAAEEEEENFENLEMLGVLCIYSLLSFDKALCWNVLGVVDRLLIELEYFKPLAKDLSRQARIFWSMYNLERELSLVLDRPSQLPSENVIKLEPYGKGKIAPSEQMINKEIELRRLQSCILDLKLSEEYTESKIRELSRQIECWRSSTMLVIHQLRTSDTDLQQSTSRINVEYYFLLIELDQLSSSESFQFTLQFLSNSFSLMLSIPSMNPATYTATNATATTSVNEGNTPVCACNLFWYLKLFKVIKNNVYSLFRTLDALKAKLPPSRAHSPQLCSSAPIDTSSGPTALLEQSLLDTISLKFSDFNSNLLLMQNLLRHAARKSRRSVQLNKTIRQHSIALDNLSASLLAFNPITASGVAYNNTKDSLQTVYLSLA